MLSIPAGFAALGLVFGAAGAVPWWVVVGGVLYGSLAVFACAEARSRREPSMR